MAAEGPERQEEGHKWPEILISVKVLKVTGVSVKLTPRTSPSLPVWRGSYVTGSWRGPSVLCPRAVMIDFRGGAPLPAAELFTCCSILAAYCTSQRFRRGLSLQRGLAAACHWLTAEAFKVGCEIRPRGPGCSAASKPLLYKPRLMRWTLHLRLLSTQEDKSAAFSCSICRNVDGMRRFYKQRWSTARISFWSLSDCITNACLYKSCIAVETLTVFVSFCVSVHDRDGFKPSKQQLKR